MSEILKRLFNYFARGLRAHERNGIAILVKSFLDQRWLVFVLVLSAGFAAVFEGGSIGLLGVAVSILMGESKPVIPEFLNNWDIGLLTYIESVDSGQIFLVLVVVVITSQVLKNILLYICDCAQIGLSYRLRRKLQRRLTNHIMSMPYKDVMTHPAGTLAKTIDLAEVVSETLTQVGHVLRAIMMTIAYAVILVVMSPIIALVTVIVLSLFWIGLNRVISKLNKLAAEATLGEVSVSRWTFEYLNAPRLLRLFNTTDYASCVINTARDSEIVPTRKIDLISKAIPKAVEIFTVVGAGGFLIGGYLIAGDAARAVIPIFFVYVLVLFRLRPLVKAFNEFRVKIANILPRAERISELLHSETEQSRRGSGHTFNGLCGSIEFQNVSFAYDSTGANVLETINFSIQRGQTVAIVGPSGAGKSTIIDLIVGLYEPTKGKILIGSKDLADLSLNSWREHIGVVDQEVFLLNSSVLENIRFGRPEATEEEVIEAANLAYAHGFIVGLNHGYNTLIGDKGFKLSGGQQQRLALARALLRKPEILILDEATSSLDSESEKYIQEALDQMHSSKTIIVIAHRLSTIVKSDWVLVVDDRQIIEQGDPQVLIDQSGHFSKAWALQSRIGKGP